MPNRRNTRSSHARPSARAARGRDARRAGAQGRRPSTAAAAAQSPRDPAITRRRFLVGAGALGAAGIVGGGVAAVAASRDTGPVIETLDVPEDAVFAGDDCESIELSEAFYVATQFELPFGTLVFCTDDDVAIALVPGQTASPMVTVSLLDLDSGDASTLLGSAAGADEGFEVLDARATGIGCVWVEGNVFEGSWRVLTASIVGRELGSPRVVDEGGPEYETPSLACVGGHAFWSVMKAIDQPDAASAPFQVKSCTFTAGEVSVVHESAGRMSCPIYSAASGCVASPRHPESTRYTQLVHLDADTGEQTAQLTLPSGMRPITLGYGRTGFAFGFEGIYDYGGGIANLGTYTPAEVGNYPSELPWFRFGTTPLAHAAWCGSRWFIVKAQRSVYAIDLERRQSCSLGVVSGCTKWGDYLCSQGTHRSVVTSSQVDQTNTSGTREQMCVVRVFAPFEA